VLQISLLVRWIKSLKFQRIDKMVYHCTWSRVCRTCVNDRVFFSLSILYVLVTGDWSIYYSPAVHLFSFCNGIQSITRTLFQTHVTRYKIRVNISCKLFFLFTSYWRACSGFCWNDLSRYWHCVSWRDNDLGNSGVVWALVYIRVDSAFHRAYFL